MVDNTQPANSAIRHIESTSSEIDDLAALEAIFVNRAYSTPYGPFIRISLGENVPGASGVKMRGSYILSLDDAAGLVHLLNQAVQMSLNIIQEKQNKTPQSQPQSEENKTIN